MKERRARQRSTNGKVAKEETGLKRQTDMPETEDKRRNDRERGKRIDSETEWEGGREGDRKTKGF